jgi:hypothetical protein
LTRTLAVHEVGAFQASFVPSLADFGRLDARFKLSEKVWERLPQYQDYGFAVFKLRDTGATSNAVHPMAFDFATRLSGEVFVPTVHVHDGEVHDACWFDHVVFVQGERCAFGPGEKKVEGYYKDGIRLDQPDNREIYPRLREIDTGDENVRNDWKLARRGSAAEDCYGSVRMPGKARGYYWDQSVASRDASGKATQQPGFRCDKRWLELVPLLDIESTLYALGLSGLLPNTDTFISVRKKIAAQ